MTSARRRACRPAGRPWPARYVHLRATSSRCQRRMVSGVTRVATCASSRRPSRCPNSARRRRSPSSKRRRRPASLAFSSRFSSRRNAMTSACSRWSHPPNAAISNWNGSTREVYATAVDPPVGHYGLHEIGCDNSFGALPARARASLRSRRKVRCHGTICIITPRSRCAVPPAVCRGLYRPPA